MIRRLNPKASMVLGNATIQKATSGRRPWILRLGLDKNLREMTAYETRTRKLAVELVNAWDDPDIFGRILETRRSDIKKLF